MFHQNKHGTLRLGDWSWKADAPEKQVLISSAQFFVELTAMIPRWKAGPVGKRDVQTLWRRRYGTWVAWVE
jgi:hypothetical protein